MSSPNDVVVTGMGVVCRLGDDLEEVTAGIRAGHSPPFSIWQAAVDAGIGCHLMGAYAGDEAADLADDALGIERRAARFMGRASRLALRASRAALAHAQQPAPTDCAVVIGAGAGDVPSHIEVQRQLDRGKRVAPTVIPRLMASTVSANLVNVLQTTGPSVSAAAACAGGAWNLVIAAQLVRDGFAPMALAGGVEAVDLHFHAGFDSMRAYNRADNNDPSRPSRPYAADRAGFIFGEGAGALVLERREGAEARGVPVLGTIRGWGLSSDGSGDMVAPDAGGAERSMRKALEVAGYAPSDVDYVNTHATSTPVGDLCEVRAMRAVFGEHRVRYSSTKGYTGHTISAAGAIEAIFTLQMLRQGWVAPSAHAEPLDPEIADWAPVVAPTEATLSVALSNSFGFGGTNATLVLGQ